MKALLLLLALFLAATRVDGAVGRRSGPSPASDDASFLEALLGGGGGGGGGGAPGGPPAAPSTGSPGTNLNDQQFLASLLSGEDSGPTPEPACGSVADAAALSDDAFLSALQGGCVPEEAAPLEPGTPCERGEFQCTPYHRCQEQDIVSDGLGAFNVRIGLAQFEEEVDFITHSECPRFGDVCCKNPTRSAPASPESTEAPFVPQCGRRHKNGLGARITGFKENESQFGELPWVVAVVRIEDFGGEEKRLFVCGGSLVHPQMVLTAAHCLGKVPNERLTVRLGEWDTQHESELLPHVDIAVADVRVHPDFHPRLLRDDVALLFLAEPAPLQPHIDTLCLPTPGVDYDGTQCVAAGWGKDALEQGHFQTVLKQIELPHVPHAECQAALRTTRLRKYFRLDRSFTCAGGVAGEDTCTGDGGAALACRDPLQPDRWVQVGVVSWGVGCGLPGIPGVYADVRRQVDWIEQMAREVEQRGADLSLFERHNPVPVRAP